ncbi:hypothetical protein PPL_10999 [Heterostelium album PN500]|uniref:Uncharacterized protein n=1 Tax=Heterostelium pallidum (strain ATCC 26659 / Pp 5 / PN500) TaxID=670386 RepID=D3BSN0_HETP5|nr:hypothetical protein PPL_10999 [Heterostelium album PN500]EFA75495.1 hypothetical protein PPL_10999 [Heterostelium album PN500]|eukprot:XP_020427629.1 hypothetical protein PPL_10999 [Heterostelium album PN500]
MSTLEQYLKIIGLESYKDLLTENGYDDPDLISELTEDELVAVGVKRGHAKRAFVKSREVAAGGPINTSNTSNSSSSNTTPTTSSPPPPQTKSKISIGKKNDDDSDSDSESTPSMISYSGPPLQSKVIFEGFLQKKGEEGFFGSKVWKKRYFRIYEEGRMAYFKSNTDVSPIKIIELRGALGCEDMEGKQYAFKISMKTSARVYYLVAQSLVDKQRCMDAAKKLIIPPVVPVKIDPNAIRPYLQHTQEPSQCKSSRFDAPSSWEVLEKPAAEGDIRLNIHSSGQVFIEETRTINLDDNGMVWIHDLPKSLDERTVHYQSITDPESFVLEQTYHNDAKTPERMLDKLIGKEIEVSIPRDDHFDEPIKMKGVVIYNPKEKTYALQNKETNTVHFLSSGEVISFNLLKTELEPIFRESSLEWMVKSAEKQQLIRLSYNAKDLFKWHANYVGVLDPREKELELRGWFTIKNKSGKDYLNSNVILIREPEDKKKEEKKEEPASSLPVPLPSVGGFKLGKLPISGLLGGGATKPVEPEKRTYSYTIDHKTNLKNLESKQICFLSKKLPVKSIDTIRFDTPKYTKYASVNKDHGTDAKTGIVDSSIIFTWNHPYSIPGGEMKLQRKHKDQFGSDILNVFDMQHYNPSDIISIPMQPLGKVSSTRTQTGFNFDLDNLYLVETFEIKVMNGREEPVRVIIEENLYRWEYFEISYSEPKSQPHPTHKRKIQWVLEIPPLDGKTINYSVFYCGLGLPDSMLKKPEVKK